MRKIIVSPYITLDGVMQAPGGPEEDFKYGGKFEYCAVGQAALCPTQHK